MRASPRSRPANAFRTLMRILSNMKWGVVAAVVLLCMSIILPGAVFLLPQVRGQGGKMFPPQAEVRGAAKMCCSRQVALGVQCVFCRRTEGLGNDGPSKAACGVRTWTAGDHTLN